MQKNQLERERVLKIKNDLGQKQTAQLLAWRNLDYLGIPYTTAISELLTERGISE
jgi:hypothetical protein